jgi:C_GCAxxG_C_C family probable redox protein
MDQTVNRAERAVTSFKGGLNCAQAVFTSFCEPLGLDRASAAKLACGLGGGMGRLGHTCGAATGAILVLGLKHGNATAQDKTAKDKTYQLVRDFMSRFQARNGNIACRELLGHDISTPEGHHQAAQAGVFTTRCPKFVRDAAEILEEML